VDFSWRSLPGNFRTPFREIHAVAGNSDYFRYIQHSDHA
jgi:hypothetical protein